MKESLLYTKLRKWAPKAFVYKTHDTYTRGIPDVYMQWNGHAIWIEAKAEHKLTGIQRETLRDLKKQGAIALVLKNHFIGDVDSFDMERQNFVGPTWDITTASFEEVIHASVQPGNV